MDFPFGHNRHRRDDDEEENQYPPPSFQPHRQHQQPPQDEYSQPPPSSYSQQPPPYYRNDDDDEQHNRHRPLQSHHQQRPNHPPPNDGVEEEDIYGRPPPRTNPQSDYGYPQPTAAGGDYYSPPPPSVQHVSHHQGYQPNPPSAYGQETQTLYTRPDQQGGFDGGSSGDDWNRNKPTVRVYTKAETGFSLTIRDGRVILAPSDENDVYQHWIKDERYSVRVKDEEGFPSFALVNKATGQAIKHSTGATHPVQLVPYNPEAIDQSLLWSESKDLGDSYRCIRMVNNIRLNMDALNGDKNHGGVRDGTTIVLWEWKKGDNQRWKIAPYCKHSIVSHKCVKSY